VALVSESDQVSLSDLTQAGAALQTQVTRDFGPIWDVDATVDVFKSLDDVPTGYWPVLVQDDIHNAGALGVHLDPNNQPFALVQLNDNWPMTASHEALEMLADPSGNRLIPGDSPSPSQGRVEFLVEICDPPEAAEFGYTVNGVLVSDFYTPNFFDQVATSGVRYSFTGAITEPRQVLRGGYLSWHDPVSDHWFQEVFFGAGPEFRDLGQLTKQGGSFREQVDRLTSTLSLKAMNTGADRATAGLPTPSQLAEARANRAKALRAMIREIASGAGALMMVESAAAPVGNSKSKGRGRSSGPLAPGKPVKPPGPVKLRRPPRRGQSSS
jgi:hypothetical protein